MRIGGYTFRKKNTSANNDLAGSVTEDVKRIKGHPLVPKDIPVYGYVYDVKTGKLIEVPEATAVGSVS
jgi:carbonic anhydrase